MAWRGAVERLLHGFAQSLLVDDRHQGEVAGWVNRTHLGGKLVYYRVGRRDNLGIRAPESRSLVHRVEIRDHAYHAWLAAELARRFDYACADTVAALRGAERAITREGQIKHPGERYEKDDRRGVDDRKHWVLGFDNREKLALFEQEGRELATIIVDSERALAGKLTIASDNLTGEFLNAEFQYGARYVQRANALSVDPISLPLGGETPVIQRPANRLGRVVLELKRGLRTGDDRARCWPGFPRPRIGRLTAR